LQHLTRANKNKNRIQTIKLSRASLELVNIERQSLTAGASKRADALSRNPLGLLGLYGGLPRVGQIEAVVEARARSGRARSRP
jgi:hypothetical protein